MQRKKTPPTILNKSFWKSRNLFSKRFLAAGGIIITTLTLTLAAQDKLLLKLPVRVADRQGEHIKNLTAKDFELLIDGKKRPIVEFHTRTRSIGDHRPGERRLFALSFDMTGYDQTTADAVAYFVERILTPSDGLLVRSPVHIYKLDANADKKAMLQYIAANLETDCQQYKKNKTASLDNLNRLLGDLEKKLNSKKMGIRSLLLFTGHFSTEWNNVYKDFFMSNLEQYAEIASRLSQQDGKADKWLIHFQGNGPGLEALATRYRKIAPRVKKYIASLPGDYREQGAAITATLDKIEASMAFKIDSSMEELLNVLLGVNLNCNFVFSQSPQESAGIFEGIARKTGGAVVTAGAAGMEAIARHQDGYYELVFKFDGSAADKRVQVGLRDRSAEVYYKSRFKKDEFKWLMNYIEQGVSEIAISGYSLQGHRLSFIISGFKMSRVNDRQAASGVIKVEIRLIDNQQQVVYETGNTLKAADSSFSVSINIPGKYKGYFKLSLIAQDMVSGKSTEEKKYIRLD